MNEIRFSHFAEADPAKIVIVDTTGRQWTRGDVASLANRLARSLRRSGLAVGDVLAIVAPNCAEYLVTYLAATQIGLYVVPVNWHLAAEEIRYILDDCSARALVVHERFGAEVQTVLSRLRAPPRVRIALGRVPHFQSLEEVVAGFDGSPLPDPVVGRVLGYTSATTGKPKGVVLPLEAAARSLDMTLERRVAGGTELEKHVQLCASVLYHGAPLEVAAVALHMGHCLVLVDRMTPESLLQAIERYQVTIAYVVPSMFPHLLRFVETERPRYSMASLRRVVHTGAQCPVDVKRRMIEWLGPILWEAYAATEGGGTLVGSTDWLRYPGTVGKAIPGTRIRIVNDRGETLPAGEIGTIYMTRYLGDRFEYLRDPERTRACHDGEFFTVGDIGYLNAEGFLFICDRKIDMINLSGMKVYCAEVENALALHPQVADCAVFGVPDEFTGEAVVAYVQPVRSVVSQTSLKTDLRRFLGEHLSMVKIPRDIELVPALARDPAGKLQKKRMREQHLARIGDRLGPGAGPVARPGGTGC